MELNGIGVRSFFERVDRRLHVDARLLDAVLERRVGRHAGASAGPTEKSLRRRLSQGHASARRQLGSGTSGRRVERLVNGNGLEKK